MKLVSGLMVKGGWLETLVLAMWLSLEGSLHGSLLFLEKGL
jgi:hypothetical protein